MLNTVAVTATAAADGAPLLPRMGRRPEATLDSGALLLDLLLKRATTRRRPSTKSKLSTAQFAAVAAAAGILRADTTNHCHSLHANTISASLLGLGSPKKAPALLHMLHRLSVQHDTSSPQCWRISMRASS
jgi:hypothetical protein